MGALSTLYICFSLKCGVCSDYIQQHFDSNKWFKGVYEICAEGARNHGLLNVPTEGFFSTQHYLAPSLKEQEKVAPFLKAYDSLIENQQKRVDALVLRKDGLLQKLFSGSVRFHSSSGEEYSPWKKRLLSDVLFEHKERYSGEEEVYSVSVSKGLVNQVEHLGRSYAAKDVSGYKLVKPGDVVYTKSPTGSFKWGIVKQSLADKNVVVSPLYGVFTPENSHLGYIIDLYFSSSIRAHNYLITLITKGAKNTINITNNTFLNNEILLPTDVDEQKRIVEFFIAVDKQIGIEEKKLQTLRTIKKGLLQKMFC